MNWWFPGSPWWLQVGWAVLAVAWLIPAAMLVDIFWTILFRDDRPRVTSNTTETPAVSRPDTG